MPAIYIYVNIDHIPHMTMYDPNTIVFINDDLTFEAAMNNNAQSCNPLLDINKVVNSFDESMSGHYFSGKYVRGIPEYVKSRGAIDMIENISDGVSTYKNACIPDNDDEVTISSNCKLLELRDDNIKLRGDISNVENLYLLYRPYQCKSTKPVNITKFPNLRRMRINGFSDYQGRKIAHPALEYLIINGCIPEINCPNLRELYLYTSFVFPHYCNIKCVAPDCRIHILSDYCDGDDDYSSDDTEDGCLGLF